MDRNYGLSTVWVNLSQARVPSMEEAVGKLTAWASSEPNWPYALVWLHKGTHHVPLPKEGHLCILPQRGAEAIPCGWISQLEVHQLLITGPQVIYPIGLNGCKEPIISPLAELLASGMSYHRWVCLPGNWYPGIPNGGDGPEGTASWWGLYYHDSQPSQVHPPISEGEGSMTLEVRNILSQAMLEMSGCRSKSLTLERPNPVVIPMPLPQKSKELLQPVDTSSQVSAEMAEASLEGISTSISPIAMASRPESITPPVDAMELWENANKALEELLATKASIEACRQRAIWELGMELHWNESKATKSIKEAKAICSLVTLDARTACSVAVKEAKMTQNCIIWEAKATCFTFIRDVEAWKASQAESLQREHGNIMQDLEMQVIQEESRSQADFLSACQATLYPSPWELKSALAASYHILLGQTPPSPPFVLLLRASPVEEQPASAIPPIPVSKQSPRPKRQHPSPDPVESMPLGRTTLKATLGGPPQLQAVRNPTLEQSTQAKPCRGIWPRLWFGKGGQEGVLLKTFLPLHHGGHPQSLRDI